MTKPKGFIIDRGLSPIDGQPYVAILTLESNNRKTGNMAQVWILCEDINPVEAVKTGKDVTICGNCPHRKQQDGSRSCYVNVGQGPNSIWKAYKRGSYVDATKSMDAWDNMSQAVSDKRIRWGAYGDPSVVKPGIVNLISSYCQGHTGYTHQWRNEFAQAFKGTFQASCDGFQDYLDATAHGWKTFTVVHKNATPNYAKQCPATVENSAAQCATCKLCDGARVDVFVHAHGTGAKYVTVA
jgi:hypothetical protein